MPNLGILNGNNPGIILGITMGSLVIFFILVIFLILAIALIFMFIRHWRSKEIDDTPGMINFN